MRRSRVLKLGCDKVGIKAISLPMIYRVMLFSRVMFMDIYPSIFIIVTLLKEK